MTYPIPLAVVTLAVLTSSVSCQTAGSNWSRADETKHIILFIGDGMQLEHEIATSQYLYGKPRELSWHRMGYSAPVSTWDVTTYDQFAASVNAPAYQPDSFDPSLGYSPGLGGKRPFPDVSTGIDAYFLKMIGATDSASSATAWATGRKTDKGNIAWLPGDPADGALKTIAELMREQKGASIGVVSTVPFSHATPAAQVSHNTTRNNYLGIASEMINDTKPNVVIGGGHPRWVRSYRYLSQTDYSRLKDGSAGYVLAERQTGVDGATALRNAAEQAVAEDQDLFGLFGGAEGNFEPPIPSHRPGAPSFDRGSVENPLLKDAALAALTVLSRDPDGFFLLLEQGDIDWANHANNFAEMIGTTWGLDEAVKAAIDFVNQPGDQVDWNNTLLLVTADHGNSYMRLRRENGRPVLGQGELPDSTGRISIEDDGTSTYAPSNAPVFYAGGQHTDELVMVYARGKGIQTLAKRQGKWYPGTQILDNTQIFDAMAEAAGVTPEEK